MLLSLMESCTENDVSRFTRLCTVHSFHRRTDRLTIRQTDLTSGKNVALVGNLDGSQLALTDVNMRRAELM